MTTEKINTTETDREKAIRAGRELWPHLFTTQEVAPVAEEVAPVAEEDTTALDAIGSANVDALIYAGLFDKAVIEASLIEQELEALRVVAKNKQAALKRAHTVADKALKAVEDAEAKLAKKAQEAADLEACKFNSEAKAETLSSAYFKPAEVAEVAPVAEVKPAEKLTIKLYFDTTDICLGGSADDWWLKDYSGDYVYSEFLRLPVGFNPVGKTARELFSIPRYNAITVKAELAAQKLAETAAAEATARLAKLPPEVVKAPPKTSAPDKVQPLQKWEINEAKKLKAMMQRNSYIKKTVEYTLSGHDLKCPYVCDYLRFNKYHAQSSFDAIAKALKPFKSMTLSDYIRMIMR